MPLCVDELITKKFGPDKWKEILTDAGLPDDASFSLTDDVDDAAIMTVVASTCKVLNLTLEQVADAFGDYWIRGLTSRHYSPVYKLHKNARELLLGINDIHKQAVKFVPGAHPPAFELTWEDDNTLIVDYKSKRPLIDFAVGITRGIGLHYNEDLQVTKLSESRFTVVFA